MINNFNLMSRNQVQKQGLHEIRNKSNSLTITQLENIRKELLFKEQKIMSKFRYHDFFFNPKPSQDNVDYYITDKISKNYNNHYHNQVNLHKHHKNKPPTQIDTYLETAREIIRKRFSNPVDKYGYPKTGSMEYGWASSKSKKKTLQNTLKCLHSSPITKFAETYLKSTHKNLYMNKGRASIKVENNKSKVS